MINASAEFREKLKDGAEVQTYADITLSDGTVLHLTPDDIWLGGCTIDDKTTDGKFGVGFAIGKTLSLRIANHDERFSVYDFYNSIINLYVAMRLDDGTIEKIRKGVYYTTVPETPGDIIEISAADGMYRLDRDYTNSATAYPASLQTIITDACLDCGIPIGFRQFDNMSFVAQEKPEKATYRQVVSWACQIAGYNARIDNNGYMELVWYDTSLLDSNFYDGGNFLTYPHDVTVDGGDFYNYGAGQVIDSGLFTDPCPEHVFRFKSLNVHTDDITITGVKVAGEDVEALSGKDGYCIKIDSNPLVYGVENEVANYLGGRMNGITFRPFNGQILGNPLYEPFEVVKVSDRKGNSYLSIVNSVTYKVGSYTSISCEAEDPARNGSSYASEAAKAVVQARRNTEKRVTEYDKAVQIMNQISMNAMGFFTTYEERADSSRIIYLHDKPTLAESRTIYKQTIDGFFLSQDGGKSYTAGFDSKGNAVFNVLYAIGIVCDWIHGGTLTLGGQNNINGQIIMLDASGSEIGRWTKDGLVATKGKFLGDLDGATGTYQGDLVVKGSTSSRYPVRISSSSGSYAGVGGRGLLIVQNGYFMRIELEDGMPRLSGGTYSNFNPETFELTVSDNNARFDADGTIKSDWTHRHTTAQEANVRVNSAGYFYRSSSSSRRYKTGETEDLGEFDPIKLYNLPVKLFRYKDGYLAEGDPGVGKKILGFIAEDVEEVFPCAVQYEDGKAETWNGRIMIPALLKLIQEQNKRIDALENKISKMEAELC